MIKKYKKKILEAYLELSPRKLLKHQFEIEEDSLAKSVSWNFTKSVLIIWISIVISSRANYLLGKINWDS